MKIKSTKSEFFLGEDPSLPNAFGPWFTHEYINYYVVQTQDWLLSLPTVEVKNNPNFNDWSLGPEHIDIYKEDYAEIRNIPPDQAVDCAIKNSDFAFDVPNKKIEPWKVLVLYSIEPDMNLDVDIDLGWQQKIAGGSHGVRHMSFNIFGIPIGQTEKCIKYYLQAAEKSFQIGNYYWAWRFLSRGLHYIADMGHPFHVNIAPVKELIRNFRSFRIIKKTVMGIHNGHEVYTQARFRNNFLPFKKALQEGSIEGSLQGKKQDLHLKKDLLKEIRRCKKKAETLMKPIYYSMINNYGDDLISSYDIIDQYDEMDLSKSSMQAENAALEVIFRDPNKSSLKLMDEITEQLLFNVGKILGMVLGFYKEYVFSIN
ncbi:MAG: hypothetical protein GY870_13040 [archaeon]|nr:hypothetical protein [archaeon]